MIIETAGFATLSLEIDGPRDADRLAGVLADPRLGLLRAKGFIRRLDGVLVTLHVVGRRALVEPAPSWVRGPDASCALGWRPRWTVRRSWPRSRVRVPRAIRRSPS